jgi:hypothetical protein
MATLRNFDVLSVCKDLIQDLLYLKKKFFVKTIQNTATVAIALKNYKSMRLDKRRLIHYRVCSITLLVCTALHCKTFKYI